jgi:hypothetical protein
MSEGLTDAQVAALVATPSEGPVTALDEAAKSLTGGDMSLDDAADKVLHRVAAFFGECVQDADFCGYSFDEKRDAKGKLESLTLVPVDMIDGTPIRRVARP